MNEFLYVVLSHQIFIRFMIFHVNCHSWIHSTVKFYTCSFLLLKHHSFCRFFLPGVINLGSLLYLCGHITEDGTVPEFNCTVQVLALL